MLVIDPIATIPFEHLPILRQEVVIDGGHIAICNNSANRCIVVFCRRRLASLVCVKIQRGFDVRPCPKLFFGVENPLGLIRAVEQRINVSFRRNLLKDFIGIPGVFLPGIQMPGVGLLGVYVFQRLPLLVQKCIVDMIRDLAFGHVHAVRCETCGEGSGAVDIPAIFQHVGQSVEVLHSSGGSVLVHAVEHAAFLVRHIIAQTLAAAVRAGYGRVQLILRGIGILHRGVVVAGDPVDLGVDGAFRGHAQGVDGAFWGHAQSITTGVCLLLVQVFTVQAGRFVAGPLCPVLRLLHDFTVIGIVAVIRRVALRQELHVGIGIRSGVLRFVPVRHGNVGTGREDVIWNPSVQQRKIRLHALDRGVGREYT